MVGHQDIDSYNLVLYLLHQAFIFVVPLINQRWFEKAFMRNTVKLCSLYPAILYLWFEQCLFLPNFLFFYFYFLFFKIVVDVKDIFLKKILFESRGRLNQSWIQAVQCLIGTTTYRRIDYITSFLRMISYIMKGNGKKKFLSWNIHDIIGSIYISSGWIGPSGALLVHERNGALEPPSLG
jgi:hypothetical protein